MMQEGVLNNGMYTAVNMGKVCRMPCKQLKKRKFKQVLNKPTAARKKLEPLFRGIVSNMTGNVTILAPEEGKPSIMPALSMEETALLGMDDVELKNIHLQFSASLRISDNSARSEVRVHTDRGDLVVAVQGDRTRPAILTYHDIGVNYACFQSFFNYVDMRALVENFCVYHVNAPGQEDGAPTLPEDYIYPTMDEMVNQINYVMAHFGLKTFIGFGVGAGAYVLAKFAINHPDKVDALALINCNSTQAGWIEWAYQKMNTRALRSRGVTQHVLDYLMWHHFGRCPEERNHDLAEMYRSHFTRNVNPANLAHFIDAYVRRSDLAINRDADTIKVPVLNITGAMSPHVDDTVTFNGRLNPNNSTWMKISDCGLVLDEQPSKISEAFRLFLQGEGYAVLALQQITSNMGSRCASGSSSLASTSSL